MTSQPDSPTQPVACKPASPDILPRPIFVYMILRAKPLLAWVLTGDASIATVSPMISPAQVSGYIRFALQHADYPAAIRDENNSSSTIDGYLLRLNTASERRKLDNFEGELYVATAVNVSILVAKKTPTGETAEADMYTWNGEMGLLSQSLWDLDTFINERLDDWLDLFQGMELVSDDE
ncbi:hypothetical protein VHEMI02732 [[Torrubiella] hemipterigena]|uniref:Putative gamma-glutamylcyclotransferase n=1 Tax=[Torrubiella] hemipterigena TaxID=1531966 RepID=A0A0A1SQL1_9HYPO|nr:hypothetical protein VHEMI02732 [[Torrubiella] hemipterigena]